MNETGVLLARTCESSSSISAVNRAISFWRDETDEVVGARDGIDIVAIVGARGVVIDPTIGPLPPPPLEGGAEAFGVEQMVAVGVTVGHTTAGWRR